MRIDHRHNFSPYSTVLYLNSSPVASSTRLELESLAFLPQLFLSFVAIPLTTAKNDLATCMLAQTFAFVTFNKVCTSQVSCFNISHSLRLRLTVPQYFLWYIVFLPFYLPNSSLLRNPLLGLTALGLWVAGQAAWLYEGYKLEFLGLSTFIPGLWLSSLLFFAVNVWILGLIIQDAIAAGQPTASQEESKKRH